MERMKLLPKELVECNGGFDMINPPIESEWFGRVFLHPLSDKKNFEQQIEKMAMHRNGIALIFNRSDSNGFHRHILERAHALFFLQGRFYYNDENGVKHKENCGGATLFVAYGQYNAAILKRCRLKGVYVPLVRKYQKRNQEIIEPNIFEE